MKKTPLNLVKERFESKDKLVAAVEKLASSDLWLDRLNDVKGLAHVSNAKLLRLHTTLTSAKEQFGSRAKLIDAILELEKRGKDAGLKLRLEKFPIPRLLDLHRSASRRAKRAQAAATPAEAKPKAKVKPKATTKATTKAAATSAKPAKAKAAPRKAAKKSSRASA
jgi:hypothetical protein